MYWFYNNQIKDRMLQIYQILDMLPFLKWIRISINNRKPLGWIWIIKIGINVIEKIVQEITMPNIWHPIP